MNNCMIPKREANNETRPERTHAGRTYAPNVDIVETGEELLLLADVPGAQAESIDINYERGVLTLQARVDRAQNTPPGRLLLHEYGVGDFVRSFRIGEGIDAARISAEVADGVLKLHLPKVEAAKPRKIEVRGLN